MECESEGIREMSPLTAGVGTRYTGGCRKVVGGRAGRVPPGCSCVGIHKHPQSAGEVTGALVGLAHCWQHGDYKFHGKINQVAAGYAVMGHYPTSWELLIRKLGQSKRINSANTLGMR